MKNKKLVSLIMAVILIFTLLPVTPANAKTKTKLSAKSITMKVGETKTIKLLNSKKRAKWSIEDEKIEVISETKKQIKFKAVDYGTTKIYAMVGKKEYKCKITIKKGQNPIPVPTLQPAPKPTAIPTIAPTITPEIEPTIVPTVIPEPTTSPTIKPTIAPTITPTLAPKNKLIYKDENVSITYTGISGEENDYDINFLIENTSNKTLEIQVRETSINSFMVDPICSMEVASNKKAEDSMEILSKDAERTPMSEVKNIETKFHIFNSDYNIRYDTENIIIIGNSSGSIDNIGNQPTSTPIIEPTARPTIAITPKPTVTPNIKPVTTPVVKPTVISKENLSERTYITKDKFVVEYTNNGKTATYFTPSATFFDVNGNKVAAMMPEDKSLIIAPSQTAYSLYEISSEEYVSAQTSEKFEDLDGIVAYKDCLEIETIDRKEKVDCIVKNTSNITVSAGIVAVFKDNMGNIVYATTVDNEEDSMSSFYLQSGENSITWFSKPYDISYENYSIVYYAYSCN